MHALSSSVRLAMQAMAGLATSTGSLTVPDASRVSLWAEAVQRYESAMEAGASYQTDTNVSVLHDAEFDVDFVLRVATALRDKPKPPKKEVPVHLWLAQPQCAWGHAPDGPQGSGLSVS